MIIENQTDFNETLDHTIRNMVQSYGKIRYLVFYLPNLSCLCKIQTSEEGLRGFNFRLFNTKMLSCILIFQFSQKYPPDPLPPPIL